MILFLHLFGYPVVAGRTPWGRRVFPSFVSPSLCPGVFLELDHEFFLNFGMVLETQMKRVAESDFLEKTFLAPKLRIWSTLGQTKIFLNLLKNLVLFFTEFVLLFVLFLLNLMFSCTNPIFGKNLILEVWVKMLSANWIARFLNRLYLQSKLME